MKLPEALAKRTGRGLHSALATTFSIEFAAVEEILLPQLWASGATNIWIAVDDRMSALALSDGSSLPQQLGRDYVLHEVVQPTGVFHPKVMLQLGRDGGRAFVSSANVTAAGLAGNVEVATEIECSAEPGPEQDFVCSVWSYLSEIGSTAQGAARDALTWAAERTPWLNGVPGSALQELDDGSLIQFLAVPNDRGIVERFMELVGGEPVEHLIVLSPFWDESLAAVTALMSGLSPTNTTLFIDAQRSEFPPASAVPANVVLRDVGDWQKSRHKHAKVVIAQTASFDHVLSGSANCTSAALGRVGFAGTNAEACVYRRIERGNAFEALSLVDLLAKPQISPEEINRPVSHDLIPLKSLEASRAGRFAVEHGVLWWEPPASPDWNSSRLELLDADRKLVVATDVASAKQIGDRFVFHIDDELISLVSLAQLRAGEHASTLAPVTHRDLLAQSRREPTSGRLARSAAAFDHAEGIELFLLDAFEELHLADVENSENATSAARDHARHARPGNEGIEPTHLSYEDFMAERASRHSLRGLGNNSLAGTHCDGVRMLLNRLIGDHPQVASPDDDTSWMDLGDEAQVQGIEQPEDTKAADGDDIESVVRPADRTAFKKAVKEYMKRAGDTDRPVGPNEVLRLRLILMAILWNARCATFPKGLDCTTDEDGWPRLVLRTVAAFFCGKAAPVRRLVMDRQHLSMPVDFVECWATVLWSIEAIGRALPAVRSNATFLALLPKLRSEVTRMLALDPSDYASEIWKSKWASLENGLGVRLFPDQDRQQAA